MLKCASRLQHEGQPLERGKVTVTLKIRRASEATATKISRAPLKGIGWYLIEIDAWRRAPKMWLVKSDLPDAQ